MGGREESLEASSQTMFSWRRKNKQDFADYWKKFNALRGVGTFGHTAAEQVAFLCRAGHSWAGLSDERSWLSGNIPVTICSDRTVRGDADSTMCNPRTRMQRALLCCMLLGTVVHLSRGRTQTLAFSLDLAAVCFPSFWNVEKATPTAVKLATARIRSCVPMRGITVTKDTFKINATSVSAHVRSVWLW